MKSSPGADAEIRPRSTIFTLKFDARCETVYSFRIDRVLVQVTGGSKLLGLWRD